MTTRAQFRDLPPVLNVEGVYIVGNKELGWYKIGRSAQIADRIFSFSLPFKLNFVKFAATNCPQRLEHALHSHFKKQRINREWFNFTPNQLKDVVQTISTIFDRFVDKSE